jgi:hypothetical protein
MWEKNNLIKMMVIFNMFMSLQASGKKTKETQDKTVNESKLSFP